MSKYAHVCVRLIGWISSFVNYLSTRWRVLVMDNQLRSRGSIKILSHTQSKRYPTRIRGESGRDALFTRAHIHICEYEHDTDEWTLFSGHPSPPYLSLSCVVFVSAIIPWSIPHLEIAMMPLVGECHFVPGLVGAIVAWIRNQNSFPAKIVRVHTWDDRLYSSLRSKTFLGIAHSFSHRTEFPTSSEKKENPFFFWRVPGECLWDNFQRIPDQDVNGERPWCKAQSPLVCQFLFYH